MNQQIESGKLLIKEVFENWYRIPEYQRPYVWGTDQISELLDDIMQARNSNKNSQYFLGSMVLKKTHKSDGNYTEYDLLDGQQRLTTLLLITAVIRDLTDDNLIQKTCSGSIFQEGNPYDNIPERMRIVFDIRDDVRDFADQYIKEKDGTKNEAGLQKLIENTKVDVSVKNMASAILHIHKYFETVPVGDFFGYFRSNVLLIYVAAQELDDAFRLFTVMNNRGVKLRNSDILKASNLSATPQCDRAKYAKNWEEMESYFGDKFDNFLSHIRTILVKKKAAVSLLSEFEDNIYNPKEFDRTTQTYSPAKPLLSKGTETFKLIEKYYDHYRQLFDQDNCSPDNRYELFNCLAMMERGFEADYWIAPLLRFYEKYTSCPDGELIAFVKALETKFVCDWIIGYTPTIRIENINKVIQAIDDAKSYQELMSDPALCLNLSEISELKRMLSGDIYGKRPAKYILLKLDLLFHSHESKVSYPDTISIEHILPQTPNDNSKWNTDFSDVERATWTNKLGNLVLISRRKNSSQGNRDFAVKKDKYFSGNIELFANSVRVMTHFNQWTPSELSQNQNLVLSKLLLSYNIEP